MKVSRIIVIMASIIIHSMPSMEPMSSSLVVTSLVTVSTTLVIIEHISVPRSHKPLAIEGGTPCRKVPRTRSLWAIRTGCKSVKGNCSMSLGNDGTEVLKLVKGLHIPENKCAEIPSGRLEMISCSGLRDHRARRS
jgi:hypothetical protein